MAGIAWVSDFIWELAQKPLYIVGTFPQFPWGWIRATTWDTGYILILYFVLAFIHQDFYWLRRKNVWDLGLIAIAGFVTSTIVEHQALAMGKWFYASTMPIVPILRVGLTPFIQLPIMAFMVYWIMRYRFSKYFE